MSNPERAVSQFDPSAALAEILRLRAWLTVLSNVEGDSTLTISYARKIRHIAKRALQGDDI